MLLFFAACTSTEVAPPHRPPIPPAEEQDVPAAPPPKRTVAPSPKPVLSWPFPENTVYMVETRALAEVRSGERKRSLKSPVWSVRLSELGRGATVRYGPSNPNFCGDCAELPLPSLHLGQPAELLPAGGKRDWFCADQLTLPHPCLPSSPVRLLLLSPSLAELEICGRSHSMVIGPHAGSLTELPWRTEWMAQQLNSEPPPLPGLHWSVDDCTYAYVDCRSERPTVVCEGLGQAWALEEGAWSPAVSSGAMCRCDSSFPPGVTLKVE